VRKYQLTAGSKQRRSPVGKVAEVLGYSRHTFINTVRKRNSSWQLEKEVLDRVHKERKVLTRLGVKKLYHQIKISLVSNRIKFGRDKLFELSGEKRLLINTKRSYTQTTMSKDWWRKYPNLIKDMTVDRPERVGVSDITYIKSDKGNFYLNSVCPKKKAEKSETKDDDLNIIILFFTILSCLLLVGL
jgi:hypothetical protein